MAIKAKAKAATKPLSRMKNHAQGTIHHIEIHPAKNGDGSLGLITHVHRNRPAHVQAAMDAGGPYQPTPEPEQTIHEDPQDAMDHAARQFGIPQEPDEDDEQGQPPAAAPQAA